MNEILLWFVAATLNKWSCLIFVQVNKMESQLQKDSKRVVQYEEEKSELEEAIRTLQQGVREMRNTLEKYTASIQVNKLIIEAISGFSMNMQGDNSLVSA